MCMERARLMQRRCVPRLWRSILRQSKPAARPASTAAPPLSPGPPWPAPSTCLTKRPPHPPHHTHTHPPPPLFTLHPTPSPCAVPCGVLPRVKGDAGALWCCLVRAMGGWVRVVVLPSAAMVGRVRVVVLLGAAHGGAGESGGAAGDAGE